MQGGGWPTALLSGMVIVIGCVYCVDCVYCVYCVQCFIMLFYLGLINTSHAFSILSVPSLGTISTTHDSHTPQQSSLCECLLESGWGPFTYCESEIFAFLDLPHLPPLQRMSAFCLHPLVSLGLDSLQSLVSFLAPCSNEDLNRVKFAMLFEMQFALQFKIHLG